MIKIYVLRLSFCVLFLNTCFASVIADSQNQPNDSKVLQELNSKSSSFQNSILCQAIALIYHLPHHRRFIMENTDGGHFNYFLAESLFFLETNQPNKLRLQTLESFIAHVDQPSDDDLCKLFWHFLEMTKLSDHHKLAGTIELVCFEGMRKAMQVTFESYKALSMHFGDKALCWDYFVAFFHKTDNMINLNVFENFDIILAVQKHGAEQKFVSISGPSITDLKDVRAVLLKSKSIVEKSLELISNEVFEELSYPQLSPTAKFTFPFTAPIWLPLSYIPIQFRLFALLPEVRGYLLRRALDFKGSYKKSFSIKKFFSHYFVCSKQQQQLFVPEDVLRARIFYLCRFRYKSNEDPILPPEFYCGGKWIRSRIKNYGKWIQPLNEKTLSVMIYSPYHFVKKNFHESFPLSLERGEDPEKIIYELYFSIVQERETLTISAPGASPSSGTYQMFVTKDTRLPVEPIGMAVYRCSESQRRFINAKLSEDTYVKSIDFFPPRRKNVCSPKMLASWFYHTFGLIPSDRSHCIVFPIEEGTQKRIDELFVGSNFPASFEKVTFQQIFEYLYSKRTNSNNSKFSSFEVSGRSTRDRTDQLFQFWISFLPDYFDLSKDLSSSIKDYLKAQQYAPIYSQCFKDDDNADVEIWDIKIPSFFLKNYPASTDASVKEDIIFIDDYYKYEPILVCELDTDRGYIKLLLAGQEIKKDVDQTANFFDGFMILYGRVKLTEEEWVAKKVPVNEILDLKKQNRELSDQLRDFDLQDNTSSFDLNPDSITDLDELKKFFKKKKEELVRVNADLTELLQKGKSVAETEKEHLQALNRLLGLRIRAKTLGAILKHAELNLVDKLKQYETEKKDQLREAGKRVESIQVKSKRLEFEIMDKNITVKHKTEDIEKLTEVLKLNEPKLQKKELAKEKAQLNEDRLNEQLEKARLNEARLNEQVEKARLNEARLNEQVEEAQRLKEQEEKQKSDRIFLMAIGCGVALLGAAAAWYFKR